MTAYIPVAVIAFSLAIYWQYASWDLLKTIDFRHPQLHAELGRPRYAVIGTPFLSALSRLLFTDCAKRTDPVLYRRIVGLRKIAAVMVIAFLTLGVLTGSPSAA
jgi:hypothetical protein